MCMKNAKKVERWAERKGKDIGTERIPHPKKEQTSAHITEDPRLNERIG